MVATACLRRRIPGRWGNWNSGQEALMCGSCVLTRRALFRTVAAAALCGAVSDRTRAGRQPAPSPRPPRSSTDPAAAAATVLAAAQPEVVVLGDGSYRYQVLEGWG